MHNQRITHWLMPLLCWPSCVGLNRRRNTDIIHGTQGRKMDLTKENDQPLVVVVITLTLIVFVLDLLTPSEIAVWTLYLVPLGLTRWSYLKHLTVSLAGACTVLIVCAHLYNPGPTQEIAIINRVFGIVMVWVVAFFLKVERM